MTKIVVRLNLIDTGRKLNVHKTFRRRPGRPLNVLCTFNFRPVSIRIAWAMVLDTMFHIWFIMTVYNKIWEILLQNATAILLQNAKEVYYKMHQGFYYKIQQFYYKMRHLLQNATILLQNATVITKCKVY